MDNAWLKVGGGHKIGCLLSVVHSVPTHGGFFEGEFPEIGSQVLTLLKII